MTDTISDQSSPIVHDTPIPLAEVIGLWERTTCPPGCHTRWVSGGKTIYGGEPPAPTVDDLSRYLHSQGVEFSVQTWVNREFVAVSLYAGMDPDYPLVEDVSILAALGEAARLVADDPPRIHARDADAWELARGVLADRFCSHGITGCACGEVM